MNLLSNRFFYFSLFISLGVIVKTIRGRFRKKKILTAFSARPIRSVDEFAAAFFSAEKAPVAAKLRELLEKTLKVELGGLLPGDSFAHDLKFDEMNRDLFQKVIGMVEDAFDIDTPPVDDCMKMTFGELVELVREKCKSTE